MHTVKSPPALAVALAGDHQRVAVVGEPVEGGAGQEVIAKRIRPLLEGAIAGHDDGPFVALPDELVEVLGALSRERAE